MAEYAAFLRAINIGGRRVTSADLRKAVEGIGFEDVSVFLASGNVVLSGDGSVDEVTGRLEAGLEAALGYEVVAFVRTREEVLELAAHQPFDASELAASKGKLQVGLLLSKPAAKVRREVLELATDEDRLAFGEREVYWLPSGGTMESGLDRSRVDRALAPLTWRTKNTIERLARKYFGG